MLAPDLDVESPSTSPSSGDLLRAAWAGDGQAWEQLVGRHIGLLWSITGSFRLGRAAAEDVIQTVWLRLLERGDTIRDPDAVTAWLVTTTRRECLAALREIRRTVGDDVTPELVDTRSPDEEILRSARDRTLWQAFRRLSERDALLLRLLSEATPYDQVAAVLNIPRGSVGPTRSRALQKLRAELSRCAVDNIADAL